MTDLTKNPNTPNRYDYRSGNLLRKWYVVPDDEIGGWAVATSPLPTSQMNYEEGELVVGMFLSEDVASHVVHMHSDWLMFCHPNLEYHATPHRGCVLRGRSEEL